MRRKLVLLLVLLLSLLLITFIVSVIMEWKPTENSYDPYLFGMHETLAYRSLPPENLNISRAFEIMHSLGVRKLRMQIWRKKFMNWTNNSTEIINIGTIEQVIQEATSHGIEIMGYAEDFPKWMRIIDGHPDEPWRSIPRRNATEYSMFLERYEESWKILAREFPNITMWEIGNEYNLYQFLRPQSGDFDPQERVDIVTDLLYYGSRGIKAGNNNSITVMGGLGPFEDSTYGNRIYDIRDFLNSTYENIESGRWPSMNPDDFFQVACWHPYTFKEKPTKQNWVNPNKAVYDIMKKHGDEDKRVVFSEIGYTDNWPPHRRLSRDKIAEYLPEVFRLAKNNFAWLDTIYWYRLTDRNLTYQGGPPEMDGYGLVESPEYGWTWKPAAYAYESLTHLEPIDQSAEWLTMVVISGIIGAIIAAGIVTAYFVRKTRKKPFRKHIDYIKKLCR